MSSVTTLAMPNRYPSFGSRSPPLAATVALAMPGETPLCTSTTSNTPRLDSGPARPSGEPATIAKELK